MLLFFGNLLFSVACGGFSFFSICNRNFQFSIWKIYQFFFFYARMNGTTVNSAERSVDPNTNTIGQRPSSSAECFIEMPKDARPDCISVTSVDINLIYKNLPDKIA